LNEKKDQPADAETIKFAEGLDQKPSFSKNNIGASVQINDISSNHINNSENDLMNNANLIQKTFNNSQPKSYSMQLAGNGVGVTIMMKPIKSQQGATTPATTALPSHHSAHLPQSHKKSNDKLFNIGFESLKLNNPVPFSALKNVKDVKDHSNSSSLNGTHNHQTSTNTHYSNSGKLPTNVLIAQRSISFKNSSLESLSNNNTVFLNNLNASVKTVANMNNVLEKDSCFTSNKGMIAAEQNNPCNISQGAIENVNNTSNCTYRVKRDSINNENTALCQNARSESSGTTRKEKKTSVGYRLGKRKLLFEKRKLFQA